MRKTFFLPAIAALASALALSSCLPIYRNAPGEPPDPTGAPNGESAVQVRFLGVGGFLIRRGEDAFLTAPLYSNPSELELLGFIDPVPELIGRFHPPTPDVKAIFVGHAHYDHLMDVPYVWPDTADAMIYGNISARNILSGYSESAVVPPQTPRIPESHVRAVNDTDDNVVDYRMCVDREGFLDETNIQGRWVDVPGTRMRFRALCSEHPPQFAGVVHFWTGGVLRPRFRPPNKPEDYQEGETHAFLIDFMNAAGTRPEFRIYYQDAPTNAPIGEVDPSLIRDKRVDLALLCVGSFKYVNNPTHIVANTDPRYVLLGHWENFFQPQDEKLKGLPGARRAVNAVVAASPGAEVYLPAPQAQFVFWPENGREGIQTTTVVESPSSSHE